MKSSHVCRTFAWLVPALLLAAGCVAHPAGTPGEHFQARMVFAPVWILFLLGIGVATAVALIATFRKSRAAGVVAALLLGLLATGGGLALFGVRHQVAAHEAEAQARLRELETLIEAQRQRAAIDVQELIDRHAPPAERAPVEAPRPSEMTGTVALAGRPFPGAEVEFHSESGARTVGRTDGQGTFRLRPDDTMATLGTRMAPLPEWVSMEGDGGLVVVSGQQFADAGTAFRDALDQATHLLLRDFDANALAPRGFNLEGWSLAPDQAQSLAVRRSFTEEIRRSAGENDFTVYRTHLQVDLSPAIHRQLEPLWRQQVSLGRSVNVGGALALLTALAAIASGYFRFAAGRTGWRRWPLRFGALAAAVVAAFAVTAGTTSAAHAIKHRSLLSPPIRVESTPAPPVVTGEDEARVREVADRMVKAINAGDYEGVRHDFNEIMLDAFPVKRCSAFFQALSSKYGKINELEPPQFKSPSETVFVARCERGSLDITLTMDKNGRVAGVLFRPGSGLPIPILPPHVAPPPVPQAPPPHVLEVLHEPDCDDD